MNTRSLFQIFLLSAMWGVSFLMIRIAGEVFPPFWLALLRCTLGAALMWAVLSAGGKHLPPSRLLPWLLAVAFLNNALPFTFFAWGERIVPSNLAAILNTTTPIWTLLITMALHRKRPALLTVAGILTALAGVLLVVTSHTSEAGSVETAAHFAAGIAVISVAALSYAVATVIAKVKLQGLDPIGLATTQLSLAGLMLLPLALTGPHPAALHARPVLAIAVLGFAGSGLAYLLYYRLLAQVSATQVAAVTYILPVWGIFWGALAHEAIGMQAYLGGAIAIAGLVLLNLPPREARTVSALFPCH